MRSPGNNTIGYVPYENPVVLSQIFQKKAITVNYDFPGYRYCTAYSRDPDSFLKMNNIFYRQTTSPGLYAPLQMVIIKTYATGDPSIEVLNNDKNKLGSGSAALLHFYDNSAGIWAVGAHDRDRYVSVIGADDSGDSGSGYTELTMDTDITYTPEAGVDAVCAAVDAGVVDFTKYVLVDQEIDFRSGAQPSAISADFAIDAIYGARLNAQLINGATLWPAGFEAVFAAACQRLILDTVQV